ncbi:hypothetical protein M1D79_10280 [Enterobacter sp. SA24]
MSRLNLFNPVDTLPTDPIPVDPVSGARSHSPSTAFTRSAAGRGAD